MRQKEGKEISWVTIEQGNPTQIKIEPLNVPEGDYELILESFDENSFEKQTLQEDIIIIKNVVGCEIEETVFEELQNALFAKPIELELQANKIGSKIVSFEEQIAMIEEVIAPDCDQLNYEIVT